MCCVSVCAAEAEHRANADQQRLLEEYERKNAELMARLRALAGGEA